MAIVGCKINPATGRLSTYPSICVDLQVEWNDGMVPLNRPGYQIEWQRQTYPSGAWATIATTDAGSQTYLYDRGAPTGQLVRYRVRSKSGGQTSAWSAASAVCAGPPPTPSGFAHRWVSEDLAEVTWTLSCAAGYPIDHIEVRDTEGDDIWLAPSDRSFELYDYLGGSSGGTIRVTAYVDESYCLMQVTTAASHTVPALADHGAPAVTAPAMVAVGNPVTVSWTPNAPSGDAQRRATVDWDGDVTEVIGDATSLTVEGMAAGFHQVTVATYGITGRSSGSTVKTVEVYGAPDAAVEDVASAEPEGEHRGSPAIRIPFELVCHATDPSGVTFADVTVYGPVAEDETAPLVATYDATQAAREAPDGAFRIAVGANGESLPDGAYWAILRARNGHSLETVDRLDFEIGIPQPSVPRLDVEVDEEALSAMVTVRGTRIPHRSRLMAGVPFAGALFQDGAGGAWPWVVGDVELATSFDVWRVYDRYGERDVLLAQGVADGDTVVDPWPPLNVPFRYRVVGRSERGGASSRETEVSVESHGAGAVNFGDDLSRISKCRLAGAFARHREPEVFEVTYKGDVDPRTGKVLPHAYPTGALTDSVDVSWELLGPGYERPGIEDHMDALAATLVLWRDPFGERWAARVDSGGWEDDAAEHGVTPCDATLYRISDSDVAYV